VDLLYLLAFFFVISLIQRAAQKKRGTAPRARPGREPRIAAPEEARPRSGVRGMLEEFRRQMEEAERRARAEQEGRYPVVLQAPTPVDDEGEPEERESLEVAPEARSLEEEVHRPARREVDHDQEAEAVVRRRIRWAEEHGRARAPVEDHRVFDERIRQPALPVPTPAAAPAGAGPRSAELKRMMVWREVLGRPVALRDDPPRR
jgi:hypothetical protein